MLKKANNKLKVKLVAIAKDEGAYLAEWIHHHLYFGFDGIDIYLNRTTDNSVTVIHQIQQCYPQVNLFNADWIDQLDESMRDNLQFIVYSQAFFAIQNNDDFDYIMFLDIDEFWTPQNLTMSISDSLLETPDAASISYGWLNMHGGVEPFETLPSTIAGQLNPLVKSAIRTHAIVEDFGLHRPLLKDGGAVIGGEGTFIASRDNWECIHPDLERVRSVMIVHRMFRSPLEYVSLLSRGRPSDNLPLKLNRNGFNRCSGTHVTWHLEEAGYNLYQASWLQFIIDTQSAETIAKAQSFVTARYQTSIDAVRNMPLDTYPQLFSLFKDCGDKVYAEFKLNLSESFKSTDNKDKLVLFKLAQEIQKLDMQFAREIIAKITG